jgi:hypothetical protein
MARLEDLTTGTHLTGLAASGSATVESVQWIGEQALKVIFRDGEGQLSEPLPHQISAVYEAMLPRQPMRFLLADDAGAGLLSHEAVRRAVVSILQDAS